MNDGLIFLVDRHSFPQHCEELDDLLSIVGEYYETTTIDTESPTVFFNRAMELASLDYELVVPITRNLYVRDRLRSEGVNLIICI